MSHTYEWEYTLTEDPDKEEKSSRETHRYLKRDLKYITDIKNNGKRERWGEGGTS